MTFEDLLQDEPYKSCYKKGRADAIDEFCQKISEHKYASKEGKEYAELVARMIAEQLKEQNNDD